MATVNHHEKILMIVSLHVYQGVEEICNAMTWTKKATVGPQRATNDEGSSVSGFVSWSSCMLVEHKSITKKLCR
jgi:hypothetical protein